MDKFRKFKYLFSYSLGKRIRSKAFLVSNIILGLCLIALVNISNIISFFGGDFDDDKTVLVFDQTGKGAASLFENFFGEDSPYNDYYMVEMSEETFDDSKRSEYLEDYSVLLLFGNVEDKLTATCYVKDIDFQDEMVLETVIGGVKSSLWLATHPDAVPVIQEYNDPIEVVWEKLSADSESLETSILSGIAMIVLVPLMMLVIFLVQFIGGDILEEKSTRAIEVIISNVPSGQHFTSKILSVIVFIMVQAALLFVYALIGVLILLISMGIDFSMITDIPNAIASEMQLDSSILSNILGKIPAFLGVLAAFTIASFVMYSVIIAVFAAMSTSMEDYQTMQTPLMLILLGGFYVGYFAVMFDGSLFVKIMGYIPLFSPMIAPIMFITGDFTIIDVLISFILLVGFDVLVLKFGLPLYRVSILSYSQEPFMKRVKNMFKRTKYE